MNDDIPASVLDSEREDLLWYRSLVDSMHDALVVVDNDEILTYVNKRFCELLKYSEKELIGKSLFSFLIDDSKPILEEQVRKRREGESSQYEIELITKDGIIVPTIAAGAPIISEDGSQGGSFAVLTDITERKEAEDEIRRAQEALKISEEKYRTLSERSLQGLTVIQEGKYVYVNKAFGDIVGYSPEKIIKMPSEKAWDMIHPHDKQMLLDLAQARNEGRPNPARYEYRFIRKDGSLRWVEAFASIIEFGGKKAHQIAVIDITDRKAAEMKLRASQEMLQLVMNTIPQFVFWKDTNLEYLGCNENFAIIAGIGNPENIIGKTDFDLSWRKEEADHLRSIDKKVIEANEPQYNNIESMLQVDGKQAWFRINRVPLHDDEGSVIGVLGTIEDITDTREAEEALKSSEVKYRTLAEQSLQGIIIVRDEGLIYANKTFSDMIGYSMEDLTQLEFKQVWNIFHKDDREVFLQRVEDRRAGKSIPPRFEYRLLRKDSDVRWVESFTTRITYQGKPATQIVFVDVSERRKAEKGVRTEKDRARLYLDLMGHDIRNQLQVILNSATLLRSATDNDTRSSFFSVIEESVQRCSRLIEEVRATEHLLITPFISKSLNNALAVCISALSGRAAGAEFFTSFEYKGAMVSADDYLELLLSNILINAIEHNPRDIKRVYVTLKEEQQGFLISIGDNGQGISDLKKSGLFDMARRFGGVGLHQSSQIIDKYGGTIEVVDRVKGKPSEGVEFRLWFPKLVT